MSVFFPSIKFFRNKYSLFKISKFKFETQTPAETSSSEATIWAKDFNELSNKPSLSFVFLTDTKSSYRLSALSLNVHLRGSLSNNKSVTRYNAEVSFLYPVRYETINVFYVVHKITLFCPL